MWKSGSKVSKITVNIDVKAAGRMSNLYSARKVGVWQSDVNTNAIMLKTSSQPKALEILVRV